MIASKEEFNELLERLRVLNFNQQLGKHLQSKLEAFEEVEGLINLPINGVVFNEAEDCRKCLKPKRMKPNTIQMLCECINSEVELCEHPFALVISKCNGEINHCLKCGEYF